jgi:hypothetical protein
MDDEPVNRIAADLNVGDFRHERGLYGSIRGAQARAPEVLGRSTTAGVDLERKSYGGNRGFAVTGTSGVPDLAAQKGLVDPAAAFAGSGATSFY